MLKRGPIALRPAFIENEIQETGSWGGYGRLGVDAIALEQYGADDFVSALGPSLHVGLLTPFALSIGASVERDIRFAGHPDETFAFLMLGFGVGEVGRSGAHAV